MALIHVRVNKQQGINFYLDSHTFSPPKLIGELGLPHYVNAHFVL